MMTERAMPSPEALYRHAEFLRAIARGLLLDEDQADDVVQQTVLAAIRARRSERGWLARAARNLSLMRRRSEGRRTRRERAAARPEDTAPAADMAARLEMQRRVADAVLQLEEPYRSAIVYRYFDGLAPVEIARRLGVPRETVKTRLRRGLALLRARFDRESGRKAWSAALLPLLLFDAPAKAAVAGLLSFKAVAAAAVLCAGAVVWLVQASGDERPPPVKAAGRPAITASGAPAEAAEPEAPAGAGRHLFRGTVLDTRGRPVAGAVVTGLAAGAGSVRTDGDGSFELRTLFASSVGRHDWMPVRVDHPGYVRGYFDLYPAGPQTLQLQPGAPLTVTVLAPDRTPLAGARVRATHTWSVRYLDVGMRERLDVLGEAVTGPDGRAEVGLVPPNTMPRVRLEAEHPAHARYARGLDVPTLDPLHVEVVLDEGGAIEGRVLGPDGEPVAGAEVFAHEDENRAARTDAEGRYRLDRLAPGGYRLFATAPDLGPGFFGASLGWGDPVPVQVRSGGTLPGIDIVLTKPAYVRGLVLDPAGAPLPGVAVSVWTGGFDGRRATGTSGADGAFRVGPLPIHAVSHGDVSTTLGAYVHFTHPQFAIESATATPSPGEEIDLGEIRASALGFVRGRVVGGAAQVLAAGDVFVSTVATEADGSFELLLPEATLRIHASAGNRRSRTVVVEVRADEAVEGIELELADVRRIAGRVVDAKGRACSFVDVGLAARAGVLERTWTDDEGRFEFAEVAEGSYEVGLLAGPVSFDLETMRADRPAFAGETQRVAAGAADVRFVLADPGFVVRGRVVADRDGRPVEDFEVSWTRFRLFLPGDTGWGRRTGPGEFVCRVPEAGTYAIDVAAPGFAAARSDRVDVAADADIGELRLGEPGAVAGDVRDAAGRAVAYARIHLFNMKLQAVEERIFTDEDGRFAARGLSPGLYNCFVVSPSHPLGILRGVPVAEGETAQVRVDLEPAAPLTIVVVDAQGRPVMGAELVYTFEALQPLDSRMAAEYEPITFGLNRSNGLGEITKPFMPAGEVIVRIEAEGYRPAQRTVALVAGEPRRIEVRLEK